MQDEKLKAEAVARDRCEQLIYQAGKAAKGMSKEQKAAVAEGVKVIGLAVADPDEEEPSDESEAGESAEQNEAE